MRIPSQSPLARVVATLGCVVVLSGCSLSPIGVKRMAPDAVARSITGNALTTEKPSLQTTNVLHRRNLFTTFQKQPVWTLAELHRIALLEDDPETWFALSELSFLHADRTGNRHYSIMSAMYAWSFLFGGAPPEPFDPRLRIASDLYNRGLTQGLERAYGDDVELSGRTFDLPIGRLTLDFDKSALEWNGRHLRDFVPVAELKVTGLNNRFRTPGIGAPLSASAAAADPSTSNEFLAPRLKTPVTALVRFHDIRKQIARREIHATLELHTDPNEESVVIDGRTVPLEKEPTAVLAAMVAENPVVKQEILAFIGMITQQQNKGTLVSLRPHVRGRIPVVFVHGTGSSPARWAEMVNVLDNDPRVNEHYEPWFFSYNSSSPIIYSSYLLRRALTDAVDKLDPAGTDTDLRNMVVIGHSQGGLLTKMTSVKSGNRFWENISSKPFDEVRLDRDDRELLQSVMFVEPLPFVGRVVFICTPHRGSFLAASDWVRAIITKMVSLPVTVTKATVSAITLNPDLAKVHSIQSVNAVDNMTPGHPFIKTLVELPVDPRIAANSIVAVEANYDPIETGNDGVVEYSSAHLDGVESEKVVRSSHSTQAVPETIEEVRRIMLQHAGIAAPALVPAAAAVAAPAAKPAPKVAK